MSVRLKFTSALLNKLKGDFALSNSVETDPSLSKWDYNIQTTKTIDIWRFLFHFSIFALRTLRTYLKILPCVILILPDGFAENHGLQSFMYSKPE